MVRVKIEFPSQNPLFKTDIPVRIGDVNYGGHVGNDAMLSFAQEARMQMLGAWGWTELQAGGTALIMADAMIAYKGEGFYGDTFRVAIYAAEITNRSFDLLYHLTTWRDGQTVEIARIKTGMLCFDYATRKVSAMTALLSEKLSGTI